MKRFAVGFCMLIVLGVGWSLPARVGAQEDTAEQWQSLSLEAFLTEADRLLAAEQSEEEEEAVRDALAGHASARLLALNAQSTIAHATFLKLYAIGQAKLSGEQRESVSAWALPAAEVTDWTFQELLQASTDMLEARMPKVAYSDAVDAWASDRSIKDYLEDVSQLKSKPEKSTG